MQRRVIGWEGGSKGVAFLVVITSSWSCRRRGEWRNRPKCFHCLSVNSILGLGRSPRFQPEWGVGWSNSGKLSGRHREHVWSTRLLSYEFILGQPFQAADLWRLLTCRLKFRKYTLILFEKTLGSPKYLFLAVFLCNMSFWEKSYCGTVKSFH